MASGRSVRLVIVFLISLALLVNETQSKGSRGGEGGRGRGGGGGGGGGRSAGRSNAGRSSSWASSSSSSRRNVHIYSGDRSYSSSGGSGLLNADSKESDKNNEFNAPNQRSLFQPDFKMHQAIDLGIFKDMFLNINAVRNNKTNGLNPVAVEGEHTNMLEINKMMNDLIDRAMQTIQRMPSFN